jgi:argininosuccinate lyase
MPQKKNPDPLELIRGKTATIQGNLVSISSIMKGLPSGYSRDLQELKPLLWKTSSTLQNSFKIMEGVVSTLSVDKKAAYNSSSKSYAIALDIAEQLIREGNISFRVAHKVIGALVDSASARGNIPMNMLSVDDIAIVLKSIDFSHPVLTSEKIYRTIQSITPENSLKLRYTKGSPNKNEQLFMISSLKNILVEYESDLERRIESLNKIQNNLINRIKYIIDQEHP